MSRLLFHAILIALITIGHATAQEKNTLPPLQNNVAPTNFQQMWAGFDPTTEPLETEIVKQWEEDGVILQIVRFRVGVFKGRKSMLAAIYGYPKSFDSKAGQSKLPGLVQIHGGGQYANHRACLMNAKRGYATVSLAWAGRISAPEYRVTAKEVKLFWDNKKDDPAWKLTTDWGAVDGYHAPSKNPGNNFPSASPAEWTIDSVESPRNSPWFLCAMAGRRALTFLEQQPQVDANRLGVYGHSMGGKLTVMTSVDPRVKAAAPSCGGISDRDNRSKVFETTICDNVSLEHVKCPIFFLSPANDFHGRIGDLPKAIDEIKSTDWRVTCSPHRNHQDSAEYEVASLLWFDQHLKNEFQVPATPATQLQLKADQGIPTFTVRPDTSREVLSVDVFYTQHGKPVELSSDRDSVVNRFWRHAKPIRSGNSWTAKVPVANVNKPLWVYANVSYGLKQPMSGAGYYYAIYETKTFNVSSLIEKVSPNELQKATVKANTGSNPDFTIESFADDWQKEWFSNKPATWPRETHKVYDDQYKAPQPNAKLSLQVKCDTDNTLVVLIDQHAAMIEVKAGEWQDVVLSASDFHDFDSKPLPNWNNIHRLKLSDAERLRSQQPGNKGSRIVGKNWIGSPPKFRELRWRPRKSQ